MTLTIELPPEKDAAFKVQAQRHGLSVEQWLVNLVEQHLQPAGWIAHLQRTNPEEWLRQFR